MVDTAIPRHWPKSSYDPKYDPIQDAGPGHNRDHAPTYWIGTAGEPPADDGPVSGDMVADVVVIGSGYTGLSTAIHLAKNYGIQAVVLEANTVAWGCSTRNGGQAQISSGRLKRSQWIQRWGVDVAKAMHAEVSEAFEVFEDLIAQDDIDCDPQPGGHYYLAHRAKVLAGLEKENALLNDVFGYKSRVIGRDELHSEHVRDQEAHGALWEPGWHVHPCRKTGIRLCANGTAFRGQNPYRKPGARMGDEERRTPFADAGRHRSCKIGSGCNCGIHAPWIAQENQAPLDADLVKLNGHTPADTSGIGRVRHQGAFAAD